MNIDYFFNLPSTKIENTESKKVLILLKKKDSKMENIELVKNILKPLSLTLDDVQLEILEEECILGNSVSTYEKIICFGINPWEVGLNINIRPYYIHSLSGTKLLFSHTLNDISSHLESKKLLWQALQNMFELIKK